MTTTTLDDLRPPTAEEIGENLAKAAWCAQGRDVITLPSVYERAVDILSGMSVSPSAKRAFDRTLMKLGSESRKIIWPPRRR